MGGRKLRSGLRRPRARTTGEDKHRTEVTEATEGDFGWMKAPQWTLSVTCENRQERISIAQRSRREDFGAKPPQYDRGFRVRGALKVSSRLLRVPLARDATVSTRNFRPTPEIPLCDLCDLCAMLLRSGWISHVRRQCKSPLCDLCDLCAMLLRSACFPHVTPFRPLHLLLEKLLTMRSQVQFQAPS